MSGTHAAILLQAEGAPPGPFEDPSFFFMMGAIFLIFYFLVIRPQGRQQKEREALIKSAAKGDKVVLSGGVHGVITGVDEATVTVEIARVKGSRVEVEVDRSGLSAVTKPGSGKTDGQSDAKAKEGSEKS